MYGSILIYLFLNKGPEIMFAISFQDGIWERSNTFIDPWEVQAHREEDPEDQVSIVIQCSIGKEVQNRGLVTPFWSKVWNQF